MKFLQKQYPDKSGTVKLMPETTDDLWLASNLIAAGDIVTTITSRKVQVASGKSKNPCRVRFPLEIKVISADYADNYLRVRGKNLIANEYIESGSFHTLEIEINKDFSLMKKIWDSESVGKLEECRFSANSYDLGVVWMDDRRAHVFLAGKNGSKLCEKMERKPKSAENKFFEIVFKSFLKYSASNSVRCVAIAGPGTIKDEFRTYFASQSRKLNNLSTVVLVNTKLNEEPSLNEVLKDAKVMRIMNNNNEVEIKAMKEFNDMLQSNSARACYGLKSVENAVEMSAIETLLITDKLFRSGEAVLRKKYSRLVDLVKKEGGRALVISADEELGKMTGIAAILRFPLPDLDDLVL